ncbi:MAG TPA: tetratricopeptide repeat protein, partial [Firmicutes bacterium]|nr:tetratricopeptide repeat protein [Bacillota bacterium]
LKQGLAEKAGIIYKKIGMLDSNKLSEKDRKRQIMIKKHTEAEKLIESGEIDKAIETYKEILQISPESFDVYQKLGELYAEKGDSEQSLKHFEKIVEVYFKNRLYKKALPVYQKILELQPDNFDIKEKIAEIYEREGNESDAKREYLALAEHYWGNKNVDKTDFYAQKAIDFKSIEAHFFKGAAMYEKKEFGEAKKEMDMLLKFKANHMPALTILGKLYKETGQKDEALNTFVKIAKASPESYEALIELGEMQAEKGLTKEGAENFMRAADIMIKKDMKKEAAEIINRITAKDPENVEALHKLADLHVSGGNKKAGADIFVKISDIYAKEGIEDKSREFYRLAEETDPGNSQIVERQKKKDPPKKETPAPAEKEKAPPAGIDPLPDIEPEKIVMDNKKTPPPERDKLKIKTGLDDIFEMAGSSEKTIGKSPGPAPVPLIEEKQTKETKEDIPGLTSLADSYIQTGAFDEGIEMYQKAMALDPGNEELKNKLNAAYSKYAGVPMVDPKKKEEEENKKKE